MATSLFINVNGAAIRQGATMLDFNNADRETQDYPFGPSGAEAVYKINNKKQITINKIDEFANLIGCDNVIGDGKLHRYGHKLTKWYVLHDDATFAAGAYGDWRDDQQTTTWCSRKKDEMSVRDGKPAKTGLSRLKPNAKRSKPRNMRKPRLWHKKRGQSVRKQILFTNIWMTNK